MRASRGYLHDTLTTAKACLQLAVHRRFVLCETHSACFQGALLLLAEVYAKQMWRPEPDIVGIEEVVEEISVFVNEMTAITSTRRVDSRAVPAGLVTVQANPLHIMYFFGNVYSYATLFESAYTYLFRNGLISGTRISTGWMGKRSWGFTRQLNESL